MSNETTTTNYCITVCNGNRMVYEREFHAESLHEAESAWRDEIRRGGSVYLYVRDGEKWTLIKEKERPDYN